MKKIIIFAIATVFLSACSQSNANKSNQLSVDTIQSQIYNHDFKEYGFTLKAPCQLQDVSSQAKGDFLVNYGGVTNPNNPETMAAYQLIVSRLPIGYKNVPKEKLESKVDEIIKSMMAGMTNLQSISFGYEGYKGYVC